MPKEIIKNSAQRFMSAILGVEGYVVKLDGISYFVTKEKLPRNLDINMFMNLDNEILTQDSPCLGIIFVNGNKIKPIVWVKNIGSIVEEQGCTTGSIASQLSFDNKSGIWIQPSGEIITIGLDNDKITIEAGVELLSDGKIYFNTN